MKKFTTRKCMYMLCAGGTVLFMDITEFQLPFLIIKIYSIALQSPVNTFKYLGNILLFLFCFLCKITCRKRKSQLIWFYF